MRRALLSLLLLGLLLAAAPARADAAAPPWRQAETVRQGLADAQSELILGTRASAQRAVAQARRANPFGVADAGLEAATAAVRSGDAVGLARARGEVRAAIFALSARRALAAAARGDARATRRWLLVRDFRTATRFTRPEADATNAVTRLARGKLSGEATRKVVANDLLDAYQGRLRELLDDLKDARPVRRAETAALAAGYFEILSDRYQEDRGAAATERARAAFAGLGTGDGGSRAEAIAALRGFTAAPLTPDEQARRAQQLLQFLELVPVEYGRGVGDGKVTKDFEIQEAVAFESGTRAALADLTDALEKRDAAATREANRALAELSGLIDRATRTPDDVASAGTVEAAGKRVEKALRRAMPAAWEEPTDESDYDLIALTLDRMEAAVGAGQYQQAEQARLEAYAFFEFGPERRLRAFDAGLALDVEGLIWFGARDQPGLAKLIADRRSFRDIRENRRALDEALADSAATLGDSANKATVVTNSAIIVFREGLEGVLILAAITASFVGVRRRLRRPVFIGAVAGLVVSAITWVLAQTLLTSLQQYGEKLEAVVGLIAIGVLLLITNWFFHRVYWSEWIGKFHRQRRRLEKLEGTRFAFISAQAIGLFVLGLTSVYREGFETVLFLQSLELSAGTATVLEGAGLGLAGVFAVAVATFALQRKLPYKKMLVVTGVLIGFVLVVMVGQTARTMQGTGWIPITSVDLELPYWAGLWFGVFPTVETIGAQIAAMVFVIGSYFLAREVQVKRKQRRFKRESAAGAQAEPEPAPEREPAGMV